nr:hypothetical protein CFP56_64093 [Quercus suber]
MQICNLLEAGAAISFYSQLQSQGVHLNTLPSKWRRHWTLVKNVSLEWKIGKVCCLSPHQVKKSLLWD